MVSIPINITQNLLIILNLLTFLKSVVPLTILRFQILAMFKSIVVVNQIDLTSITVAIIAAVPIVIAALIAKSRPKLKKERNRRGARDNEEKESKARNASILSIEDYAEQYRKSLLSDDYIIRFRILNTDRDVMVTDAYIPLHLSKERRTIDELAREAKYDPRVLPRLDSHQLSDHMRDTLEPEKAISLCTRKCCLIVGDPGAGKTVLLKYLAIKSASRELEELPHLPIYIELNAFAITGKSKLLDYTSADWEKRYHIPKGEASKCIDKKSKAGKILWLLNGLDESATGMTAVETEASYKRVTEAIMQLGKVSPVVVTTRRADNTRSQDNVRSHLIGFEELEVLDYRPEDIRTFVNSWFASHPDPLRREDAGDLNTILEGNSRIMALARNPLLLAQIATVYEERRELPQDRPELYKRCVNILLTKWNVARNSRRLRYFNEKSKTKLLEEIAWYFHLHGQRYFPKDDLLELIKKFLPDIDLPEEQADQVLDAIALESGLLKEQAPGWYGFLHLTMQEYFVAQQICSERENINILLKYCDESWWEEVLYLYAAYTNDVKSLLGNLLERGSKLSYQEDIFRTNLNLAGHCLAVHRLGCPVSLRDEIILRLFDALTSTPYSLARQQITKTLAEIGGSRINTGLLNLLSDESVHKDMRLSITLAFDTFWTASLGDKLLNVVSDPDMNKDVRKHIANLLGRHGDRSMIPSLLNLLRPRRNVRDIDEEVAVSIADALGTFAAFGKFEEGDLVISDLISMLSNKHLSLYVRGRIAYALGKSNQITLVPLLMQKLSDAEIDRYVRMRITDALGLLGKASKDSVVLVRGLSRLLSHRQTDQGVRMSIADALAVIGDPSIAPDLKDILFNQSDNPDVCGNVAITLGILGDQSIISILLNHLSCLDIDDYIRQCIVIALRKLAERYSSPNLIRQISDSLLDLLANRKTATSVRVRIADILGSLGNRTIAADLLDMLFGPGVELQVREAIVDALGRLGEQTIAADLLKLLSDSGVELSLRGRIAYVLGRLRKSAALPMMVELLTEERLDPPIRWLIANSLGTLGEQVQPSLLIPLLTRTEVDMDVRRHIVEVLPHIIDDEVSVQELTDLLQTSDIADSIYSALWLISRKMDVRIIIPSPGKRPEVVRWRTEIE